MANPLWIPGCKSANPKGRGKNSVRSIKGMVERFITRNISPTKLQRMYNSLTANQQIEMLLQLLPYAIAKQSSEGISKEEVEKLYQMVEEGLKNNQHGQSQAV